MTYEPIPVATNPVLSEQLRELRTGYSVEAVSHFDRLLAEMASVAEQKPDTAPDPYMHALFTCVLDDMDSDSFFHEILLEYSASNTDDKIPVGIRKLYSSFQELVIPVPLFPGQQGRFKPLLDHSYPKGYDQPATWQSVVSALKQDPLGERLAFGQNLLKPLQSNILTRFLTLMVAPQLFGVSRVNTIAEGSSFGLLESMGISYPKDGRGLDTYRVGPLVGSNPKRPWFPTRSKESRQSTRNLVALANNPKFRFGHVLGIDQDPPVDPLTRSYAYSNCFRGPEFGNEWYRTQVQKLLLAQPKNMRIIRGDYTSPNHPEEIRRKAPEFFRLPNRWVTFISTQYQHGPEAQQQADYNARQLAGKNGYLLHMDFVERQADGTLEYLDKWPSWHYNLFVTPPGGKPLHIFRMRNGRALDIAAGADIPTTPDGLPILQFGVMR